MMWSTHSRRIDPISLSVNAFCNGDVFEPSFGAKLLELLKEIAPHVGRVANPASWSASAVAAAPKFAVEVVAAPLRDSNEIEAAMAQWGREPNFGLILDFKLAKVTTTHPHRDDDIRPAMWLELANRPTYELLCIHKSSKQAGNLAGGM